MERLNLTNIQHQHVKSPTRIHSKTQQNVSSKDEEIENMKKEMQLLKQTQNESKHHQFQTTLNGSNKCETNNPKNTQMASASGSQNAQEKLIKLGHSRIFTSA